MGTRDRHLAARIVVALLVGLIVVAGTAAAAAYSAHAGPLAVRQPAVTPAGGAAPDRAASPALTVALYPWAPRPAQVERAVADAWQRSHPDVPLHFVDWDCYTSDPPAGVDIFVFDTVMLRKFVERGVVQRLADDEVDDSSDVLPYALRAGRTDDGALYGIPMIGCAIMLFYRDGDTALERADDLGDLVDALGPARYDTLKPPRGKGLLIDLSDAPMDAYYYLEALQDTYGVYTDDPPLAPTAAKLDRWALADVRDLRIMAGARQASAGSTGKSTRAQWFGAGRGRALIGFSESLNEMSAAQQDDVRVKIVSFSDSGRHDVRLFYTDIVGLAPALSTGPRRDLALELANLITSTQVMVAALGPSADDPVPQYLFSVRRSVYDQLAPAFPLYAQMAELTGATPGSPAAPGGVDEPQPVHLAADMDPWFATMAPVIKRQVFAGR